MENLWIEIVDGHPVNHPYLESNLLAAYPEWAGVVPASKFAPFVRVTPPTDAIVERVEYQFIDGVWTDVFVTRPIVFPEPGSSDPDQNQ
jgi:hypothetical protein